MKEDRTMSPGTWSGWTFTFKPTGGLTALSATLQLDQGNIGEDLAVCKQYLREALLAAQVAPAEWWKRHGRSVYYLMRWDLDRKPPPSSDLGRFETSPEDVIPWLNQKLGTLEQATTSETQLKAALLFLLKWTECSCIEENPRHC